MNKFVQAIRSQEAYMKKPKPKKNNVPEDRRPPVKESQIMRILLLQNKGVQPRHIAGEVGVPVQTIYNVRQRYCLIDVEGEGKRYNYLGV